MSRSDRWGEGSGGERTRTTTAHQGAHAAFPPQARLPPPKKLGLLIGQPLTFAHLVNQPDSWREIAATTEAAVRELVEVELV